jgi:hypothetical protein
MKFVCRPCCAPSADSRARPASGNRFRTARSRQSNRLNSRPAGLPGPAPDDAPWCRPVIRTTSRSGVELNSSASPGLGHDRSSPVRREQISRLVGPLASSDRDSDKILRNCSPAVWCVEYDPPWSPGHMDVQPALRRHLRQQMVGVAFSCCCRRCKACGAPTSSNRARPAEMDDTTGLSS